MWTTFPTIIGPLKRGRPVQTGSAAIDDALRGPRINSSTQSPSSGPRQARVGGVHHGTFSLKLFDAMVVVDSPISAASYLNVAEIDGYVPGMGMMLPEEGSWSVAFSFGVCEAQRLRAISRLFVNIVPTPSGPRQLPEAGAPLVGVPPVARAGAGPSVQPSLGTLAEALGRITHSLPEGWCDNSLVGPGRLGGIRRSPSDSESVSSEGCPCDLD